MPENSRQNYLLELRKYREYNMAERNILLALGALFIFFTFHQLFQIILKYAETEHRVSLLYDTNQQKQSPKRNDLYEMNMFSNQDAKTMKTERKICKRNLNKNGLIDQFNKMIKVGIVLFAMITLASCLSYSKFNEILNLQECKDMISTCDINFYANPVVGEQEIECAQDISKAQVCFSNYKQCFPASTAGPEYDEEMPVVCWQCYMDIDSDSSFYKNYVGCLKKNGSNYFAYSVLLLLVLMFMA